MFDVGGFSRETLLDGRALNSHADLTTNDEMTVVQPFDNLVQSDVDGHRLEDCNGSVVWSNLVPFAFFSYKDVTHGESTLKHHVNFF